MSSKYDVLRAEKISRQEHYAAHAVQAQNGRAEHYQIRSSSARVRRSQAPLLMPNFAH